MLLCLTRHGETDWNAQGRIQGQLDIPLNQQGERQAAALAGALAARHFDALYASDLQRAQHTAAPLASRLGLPLQLAPSWRERHHGRMQGRTYAELAAEWPEGHARLRARDPDFDVEGGETLHAVATRCQANLDALRQRHAGQTVLVVTHGGILDVIWRLVTGTDLRAPRTVAIRNCAIHWLQRDDAGFTLLDWGQDAHLAAARDELPG